MTPEQVAAGNRYASYMRGWRDGAKGSGKRLEFTSRPADDDLRLVYEDGWVDGCLAYNKAAHAASELFGHVPSILRTEPT